MDIFEYLRKVQVIILVSIIPTWYVQLDIREGLEIYCNCLPSHNHT